GGWPLSVFVTPDLNPFYTGTYFPKVPTGSMPSFKEVLAHLEGVYKTNRAQIEEQGRSLLEQIAQSPKLEKKVEFDGHFPSPAAIMNAIHNYADKANGGYGQAPKFPHFAFLEWACEQILEGMIPQDQGQHIVDTIEKMMMGGLYDQIKGGIHRYSTDAGWVVPHFEKMLYDQAGLLKVLAKVTPFYPSPLLFDGILQTLEYLNSEMVSDDEFFMAAQDADSEGQEGLYFTFSKEEFEHCLKENSELGAFQPVWTDWFRITDAGNFEQGLNVISLNPSLKNEFYSPEGWEVVRKIRHALLEERKQRIPPATDRKGVASWNFMILSALCDVIQYSRVPAITQSALKLLHKVIEGVSRTFIAVDASGRHVLRHTTTTDKAPLYLEDYVQFCESQLRLYEVTSTDVFLVNAKETMDFIRREFFVDKMPSLTAVSSGATMRAPLNDQSYRSTLATLLLTSTRLSVIYPEYHPELFWGAQWHEWIQLALSNPVSHGEALRVFTYPLEIYRRVEVPRPWVNDEEFQRLRSHFLGRFVIDYHDRPDEKWQVCNRTECEKQGQGLESLLETFSNAEAEVQ
ncbi:MAG: thioredoxin domain-containing protein, partial [Bacteriovoracia bacterium]